MFKLQWNFTSGYSFWKHATVSEKKLEKLIEDEKGKTSANLGKGSQLWMQYLLDTAVENIMTFTLPSDSYS